MRHCADGLADTNTTNLNLLQDRGPSQDDWGRRILGKQAEFASTMLLYSWLTPRSVQKVASMTPSTRKRVFGLPTSDFGHFAQNDVGVPEAHENEHS